MSVTLLVLAAATPDLAFDGYAKCAHGAAASYKGSADFMEALVGRLEADCGSERTSLLQVAPDECLAAEWVRMTTTLAVTEHGRGLRSEGAEAKDGQTASAPVATAYPKLAAYRQCGTEYAARTEAERPSNTAESIATDATGRCGTELKAATDEPVAEMRQPRLRQQVMLDFRRRSIADLTQKITAQRAGKK